MMKSRLELFCVLVLCFSLLLSQQSAQAYTVEDVDRAREQKDYILLKRITDDSASEKSVRLRALESLERDDFISYLDSPLVADEPAIRFQIFVAAARVSRLPVSRYPEAFKIGMKQEKGDRYLYTLHRLYLTQLGIEGRWKEAVSESKRLIGLTRPEAPVPAQTLEHINIALKGESFSRTKDVAQSLQAMQEFSQDVRNHTQKSPWFQVPFPGDSPLTPFVAPLETSQDPEARIRALLYAGKFDAARRDAEILYGQAATSGLLRRYLYLIAQSINGKAQRVDAANELLMPAEAR